MGASTVTATITAVDDAADDEGETIEVTVKFNNAQIGETQTIAIIDDDEAANAAPQFTSGASFSVEENETLVGTVEAKDADAGDEVSYAISGGADMDQFQINAMSGELSFMTAPDYENPADVESTDPANAADNNEYIVIVTATGGTGTRALTADQTITVTVNDVDETLPVVSIAAVGESVDEGAPAQFTLTLSKVAPAGGLIVAVLVTEEGSVIAMSGDYTSAVTVAFAEGETEQTLSVATEDDDAYEELADAAEAAGRITATVQAGTGYELSASASATVTVNDDEPSPITVAAADAAVVEGAVTVTVTITATTEHARMPADAVAFGVSTEAGTATAGTDYTGFTETVTIAVADFALDSGTHYSAATTVTVTIIDDQVVEDEEILTVKLERSSNTPAHATLVPAKVTITDNDVPNWAVNVDPNMIAEAGGTSTVMVSTGGVTFPAVQTIDLEFAGTALAGTDFTVADAGGTVLTSPYQLSLSVGASTVMATITAVDDDADDEGETIEVTVKFNDAQIGETQTIAIIDDDEAANAAPQFTSGASFSVEENETLVGTVEATDADAGDEVSYAISGGADMDQFQIDTTSGVLSFRSAPDYENPADADGNNEYIVTVTATGGTDARALTADQTITVTVDDVVGGFCERTPQVRDAILTALGETNCGNVGDDDLATVTSLILSSTGITSLQSGDFSGLTALTELRLNNNDLESLPAGIFADLTALTLLYLYSNELSSLPDGIFAGLTRLEDLFLNNNQLRSLPAGVFSGLTALETLNLSNNAVDPLPIEVSLEKVGDSGFKVIAPTGAPFELVLPITVTNGMIVGGATTVTIPAGDLESASVTVARTSGTTGAVTANIGTLPGLPSNHTGYVLQKSALPLAVLPAVGNAAPEFTSGASFLVEENETLVGTVEATDADDDEVSYAITGGVDMDQFAIDAASGVLSFTTAPDYENPADADSNNEYIVTVAATGGTDARAQTAVQTITVTVDDVVGGFCERTPQVRDAILAKLSETNCGNVGDDDLATVTGTLDVNSTSITSLQSGDFSGLTALTSLRLNNNELSSLPDGIFADLTALTELYLSYTQLSSLPDGIFAGLGALTTLLLNNNELSSLPDGIFADLTALTDLYLSYTQLSSLPDGIFAGLTRLEDLFLNNTQLSSLPDGIFAGLTRLEDLFLNNTQLNSLPDGIFAGLGALTNLNLSFNPVNPLPIPLSLEKVGDSGFKAVAPTGAPFELVLPITVTNGMIVGGATTVTIPAGDLESASVTVARTSGTTGAVTADIGTLPALPNNHQGYVLQKADALPLEVLPAVLNAAPQFTSAAALSVNENETLVGTVEAADADAGDAVRYAITGGADMDQFAIDATSGALSFTTAPDYENPADVASTDPANVAGNNEYIVVVTATSGADARELTAEQTITVTVNDVDETLPTVSIAAVAEAVDEGSQAQFTLTLSRVAPEGGLMVSVLVTEEGSVLAMPGDYTSAVTVAFAAGETHQDLSVDTADDDAYEELDDAAEAAGRITATVQAGTGYELSASASATVAVHDDDPSPITVAAADASVVEGDGTVMVTITATTEHARAPVNAVAFGVITEAGTATVNDDYTGFTETVTIAVADFALDSGTHYSAATTVTVTIINDQVVEDEEILTVKLERSSNTPAHATLGSAATVTITDNDVPNWAVNVAPNAIAEAGGTSTVTVSTGGVTFPAVQTIDLEFTGTALAGTDFTVADAGGTVLTSPYRLSLSMGESTVLATITAVDDAADDDDETIEVTAKRDGAQIGDTRTITITDDDEPPNAAPQFTSGASFSVEENETLVGTVEATDVDAGDEVSYAITSGADMDQFQIDAMSGELSFQSAPDYENPADVASTDPANVAGNNEYIVVVTATSGADARELTAEQTITVTVIDVDETLPTVSIAAVAEAVDEGSQAQFTLTLSRVAPEGGLMVAVLVTEEGSVIDAPDNYTSAVTVTITQGQMQQALSVDTADDAVFETLDDAAEAAGRITATVQAGTGYELSASASATVAVHDDDPSPITVAAADASVVEGDGTVMVTITATTEHARAPVDAVAFGVITEAGTATAGTDYTGFTEAVTIAVADFALDSGTHYSAATTVTVTIINDQVVEDEEMLTVKLERSSNTPAHATLGSAATVTITDNDVPNWAVNVDPNMIAEAGGTSTVMVSTGGVTFPAVQTIDLEFVGTAVVGTDFTVADAGGTVLTSPYQLSLSMGESTVLATITAVDDAADDDDETIEVTAKRDGAQIGDTRTITITDDEPPNAAPQFTSGASFSVEENETLVGTVEATDADAGDEVSYAITGGADMDQFAIDAMSGELSFQSAPDFENPADVASTDPANAADNNEYIVTVTATGGTDARALTADQTITVTVDDVDETLPTVSIAAVAEAVDEGAPAQFTLTLSRAAPEGGLMVAVLVTEEGSVLAVPGDYTSAVTVTITQGQMQQALSVDTADDAVFEMLADAAEAAGRITATAQAGTGYELSTDASATVTVNDDDPSPITVTAADESVAEGAGTVTVTITATTEHARAPVDAVAFEVSTEAGTAIAGTDYTGFTEAVTIAVADFALDSGTHYSAATTVTVTIINDQVVEDEEMLTVKLASSSGTPGHATLEDPATVTITDDDVPNWAVSVDPNTIAEAGGTATVTVSTGGVTFPAAETIELEFAGTTEAGTDFTVAVDGSVLTSPYHLTLSVGASTVMATITAVDDAADDDDETIEVTAKRDGAQIGDTRTITITDDDEPPNAAPVFTSDAAFPVNENETTVGTVVATDADAGDAVSYAITSGADMDQFAIDAMSGALSFRSAPDYENPADVASTDPANVAGNNEYIVVVTATSGADARELTAEQTITVTVNDVDETSTDPPSEYKPSVTIGSPSIEESHPARIAIAPAKAPFKSDQTITLMLASHKDDHEASPGDYTVSIDGTLLQPSFYKFVELIWSSDSWPHYTLTLPAGETQIEVFIAAVDDEEAECQETIFLYVFHGGYRQKTSLNIKANDLRPEIESAEVNGNTATLTFNRPLQWIKPPPDDPNYYSPPHHHFSLSTEPPTQIQYADTFSLNGRRVVLTFAEPVTADETVWVVYDQLSLYAPLGDGSGCPCGRAVRSFKIQANNTTRSTVGIVEGTDPETARAAAGDEANTETSEEEPQNTQTSEEEPQSVALPALTASFTGVPASHDGTTFTFGLSFSEPVATSYKVLRDQALSVSGGTARRCHRVDGSSRVWKVHIEPDGHADVTVRLSSPANCGDPGAVCTADGRSLSNGLTETISGKGATILAPNVPNPFNPSTHIAYRLAAPGPVRLEIYNILGQRVRTLVNQVQAAGAYQFSWNARNESGQAVSTGVYIARLHYPGGVQTRYLLYLK